MNINLNIKDGDFTSTIYGLIKQEKFNEAIRVLQYQNEKNKKNRAALSLLAYCYFQLQEYANAAECYGQLAEFFPEKTLYRLYHAQSLYNAFMMNEALAAISMIEDPDLLNDCVKLEAAIKYREEDINNSRILVEQLAEDDPHMDFNLAAIEYKEDNIDSALEKFQKVASYSGYSPELAYCIALCFYRKKNYAEAMKFIAEIIDRGLKDHPEFNIGLVTEGIELASVGNSQKLHESSIIEAFNLKFAIEYNLKDYKAALDALTDMPPRNEHELDSVSLHNYALIGADNNPSDTFAKLQYLLGQNPFPNTTLANLVTLYCKYEYLDLAADIMAENAHLLQTHMPTNHFDYVDLLMRLRTDPTEALAKLEKIGTDALGNMRRIMKEVEKKRAGNDETGTKKLMEDYDDLMEKYLPILMVHAKYFWDKQNYQQVERLFRASVDCCQEHDTWKLNVAHTIFMQEQKFKEAADFYEPIVNKNYDNILEISAIILSNLCVCYIMTNKNEEAEELMRKVEREEEEAREREPNKKVYHGCIINLVIGTLYCSKGNFEFGISRVIKAMEPQDRRLGTDTWYYAKRCLLATIETMSKHLVVIRDAVIHECIAFLEKCEVHGRTIRAAADGQVDNLQESDIKNTVTYEARLLKALLLRVISE